MDYVRRYDAARGRNVEANASRVRPGAPPHSVDEQHEIARRYYPDGRLEAERLRFRRRQTFGAPEVQDEGGPFVIEALKYFILSCAIWGFSELGEWALRDWWGALVGIGVLSVIAALGKE